MTGRSAVGNGVATVARSTPVCRRNNKVEAARMAPVLPDDTNASDLPAFCRPNPSTMLEFCFLRMATSGLSAWPMTSVASTISIRDRSSSGCRASSASMTEGRPTSWIMTSSPSSAKARDTPSISTAGALSPPITSSAMRITFSYPRPQSSSCRDRTRRSRTLGAAAWAHHSGDRPGTGCPWPGGAYGGAACVIWTSVSWELP